MRLLDSLRDERKSFSTEQTFSEMSAPVEMYQKLYELCDIVCKDLKNEQLMVRHALVAWGAGQGTSERACAVHSQ